MVAKESKEKILIFIYNCFLYIVYIWITHLFHIIAGWLYVYYVSQINLAHDES